MGFFNPLKAFLAVALIRISPSVGDGIGDDIVNLSTVSEVLQILYEQYYMNLPFF